MSNPLEKLTRDEILAACDLIKGDGHTVWKPEAFLRIWPKEAVKKVAHVVESDGSAKGTLFGNDGQIIWKCMGVYGLDVLGALCSVVGAEARGCLGRGFQARAYDEAIRAKLAEDEK